MESFRAVFLAVFIGTALLVAAVLVEQRRSAVETEQPTAALVRATAARASPARASPARGERGAMVARYGTGARNAAAASCVTNRLSWWPLRAGHRARGEALHAAG